MDTKGTSTVLIVIVVAIFTIGSIVWGLLKYWNSQPEPTTYVIVDTHRNTSINVQGTSEGGCGSPYITTVRDIVTEQISQKCGKLGKRSELISLYE